MFRLIRNLLFRKSKPEFLKESSVPEQLATNLKTLAVELQQLDPYWAKEIAQLAHEASSSFLVRHDLGVRVKSLFGGMGSFNDVPLPDHLESQRQELFRVTEDYLRLSWRSRNAEWNNISPVDLIPVGTSVTIVAGEQVRVDSHGRPEYQQLSEGPFQVLRHLEPDMTNMPMYLLGRESERGWENRFVRQNALQIAS